MKLINTSNVKPYIKSYLQSFKPDIPALKRTVKEFAPYAIAASGIALGAHYSYENFLPVKEVFDCAGNFLKQNQRLYEFGASAIGLGLIPDVMAQRYEILSKTKEKFDYKRAFVMSLVGAISGGLIIRQMFDFNLRTFEGYNFSQVLKRVLFDQFIFTPPYLGTFFAAMHVLNGGKIKQLPFAVAKKLSEVLPINWIVFGGCFSWIIYTAPSEAMIYVQTALAVLWRSFLYHKAASDVKKVNTDVQTKS